MSACVWGLGPAQGSGTSWKGGKGKVLMEGQTPDGICPSPPAPLLPGAVDTEIRTLDLASVSQLGVILTWRHLVMSEDILDGHNWKMLLALVGRAQGCC